MLAAGWKRAANAADCDVAILNTCTVTGEADAKNRKTLRTLLKADEAAIIVTGCAVNIDAERYADIDSRISCEHDKEKVPALAMRLVRDMSAARTDVLDPIALRGTDTGFRTRVDLKIQDGCDNACSYCIVHVARGPAHSVPAATVLSHAQALADTGTRELVLVGIDLAAYQDGTVDLAQLVTLLQEETDIGRVRISSVEPQSVTPSLIDVLVHSEGRLCRHLHLCLQSGSSKVLREMNRHYNADEFVALVDRLRTAVAHLALSTDIIVGFPGESDEDFARTCELVEHCGFMRLHVFRYSKRPGTPAAERSDQIDPRIKAHRSQTLIELGERLALADMERRVGTSEQIVVERPGLGTSESYHTIACDAALPVGTLVEVEFTDIDTNTMCLLGK